jgi:peptide/nickel transport system permease protein
VAAAETLSSDHRDAVDPITEIVTRARRFPTVAAAVGGVGLVVLLLSMFVLGSMATVPRSFLAAAGGAGLWYGVQKLGAYKLGPKFSLGLILSVAYMVLLVLATIFANFLPIEDFKKTVVEERRMRPSLSFYQPLGRDTRGGSLVSQVIYAGRVSLTIVVIAVLVGLLLGSILGLLAGYFGGWFEGIINIGVNTTLAFPPLILLIVIAAVYNRSVWSIGLGLAIVSVPTYARLMRAQTLAYREREFVTASRAMGATGRRIMFREILPNAALPVLSYTFINAAVVIIAEGSLAYLGLSVKFPKPTWGALIADGQDKLKTDPHLVFVPAAVMFITVLALNRVGDWARTKAVGERNLLA